MKLCEISVVSKVDRTGSKRTTGTGRGGSVRVNSVSGRASMIEVVSFDERMCHMEERNRGLSCSVLFGGTSSRFGVENDAIFWSGCLLEIDRNPICFLLSR